MASNKLNQRLKDRKFLTDVDWQLFFLHNFRRTQKNIDVNWSIIKRVPLITILSVFERPRIEHGYEIEGATQFVSFFDEWLQEKEDLLPYLFFGATLKREVYPLSQFRELMYYLEKGTIQEKLNEIKILEAKNVEDFIECLRNENNKKDEHVIRTKFSPYEFTLAARYWYLNKN